MARDSAVRGFSRGDLHGASVISRSVGSLSLCACLIAGAYANDKVWLHAASVAQVPVEVLQGIALAESGVRWKDGVTRPWPWTLNSPVGPMRFASKSEAAEAARTLIANGYRNVDLGLMQVNWGYHGHRVDSVEALLDPATNIRIAAQILGEGLDLHAGDTRRAVGAYHSGRPERAKPYAQRVMRYSARLAASGAQ